MFPEAELSMYNDGPLLVEDFPFEVKTFDTHLGRPTQPWFPGWARSFLQGLRDGCNVHIESDLYILKPEKIKPYFSRPGYYSGHDNKYGFMESALQIINSNHLKDILIKLIEDYLAGSETNPEPTIEHTLYPIFMMEGYRFEHSTETTFNRYDYLAQISKSELDALRKTW